MSETDCKIVSSRGIMKSCDIYSSTPRSSIRRVMGYDFSKIKQGDTVYICTSAIQDFISTVFKDITVPFILVTGDCDESSPDDLFESHSDFINFIESPTIIHWHSQNCIEIHPKLSKIPIGMDYHTMASTQNHEWGPETLSINQEKLLLSIKKKALPLEKRLCKAYANFQFLMTTTFGQDRKDAIKDIPEECVYYEPTKVPRLKTWSTQSKYAFVVSPHGNGLDCHRTWEAIALGCIPIVKTSDIDSLFDSLPVWIVNDWSEITQESMSKKIEDFKTKKFALEKMNLSYWMKRITNSSKIELNTEPHIINNMIYLIITTSITNKYAMPSQPKTVQSRQQPQSNQWSEQSPEFRQKLYLESIKKTLSLLPEGIKPIIVENNGKRSTFLDSFKIDVHYTMNNQEMFQHKGINELNDIKSVIDAYDIKDEDTIIKITGRYSPLNDVFFKFVEAHSDVYDAFVKFYNVASMLFMEDDCVLGMFAAKCKLLKEFEYDNSSRSPEVQFAQYINGIEGEVCDVGILYLHCCFSETMKWMDV